MKYCVYASLFALCLLACAEPQEKHKTRVIIANSSISAAGYFSGFLREIAAFHSDDNLDLDTISAMVIHTGFIPGIDGTERIQLRQALEALINCRAPFAEPPRIDIEINGTLLARSLAIPAASVDTLLFRHDSGLCRIRISNDENGITTDTSLELSGGTLFIDYVNAPAFDLSTALNRTDYLMPCLDKFPKRIQSGLHSFFLEYAYILSHSSQANNFKTVPEGFIVRVR